MAVLHAEVFSESLMRKVPLTCLIPADKCDYANLANEKPTPRPYRTLYLLHGAFGSETDYLMNSRIAAYADQYKVAIIMPAGELSLIHICMPIAPAPCLFSFKRAVASTCS